MNQAQLQERLTQVADELGVPGVAVGVHHRGEQQYAVHGVTNVEHPLAVDAETLFPINSTGKTFTGTAMMSLVDRGIVGLEAPVRTYVPELRLQDEDVTGEVTPAPLDEVMVSLRARQ